MSVHGRDTCPDCMFAQLCGETPKTNQCSFMKHSEMSKLVLKNTAKMEGQAINKSSTLRLHSSIIGHLLGS